MNDSDDDIDSTSTETENDQITNRQRLLGNELRSFKNRGFHDGYDEGKKAVIQEAFDSGYKKAFERNFALSTLKGVAQALRNSFNLTQDNSARATPSDHHHHHQRHDFNQPLSDKHQQSQVQQQQQRNHQKRPTSIGSTVSSSLSRTRSNPSEDNTTASCSSASSSASGSSCNVSNTTGISSNISSVNISSNHLSTLESMKFDQSSDIESIKSDLIKICRENRLEILAHYVSQIM